MLIMKESVEFERINNTTLVFLCSNCLQVTKIFYDCPINYYFLAILVFDY